MTPEGRILAARHGRDVFVRIEGRGTHKLGPDFERFIAGLVNAADFDRIAVDLSATVALDSTMLGLLARVAKWMRQHRGCTPAVLGANADLKATVRGVGLDRLVDLVEGERPVSGTLQEIPQVEGDRVARVHTILNAHRELIALNDQNATQFKSVVEFLEKDTPGPLRP